MDKEKLSIQVQLSYYYESGNLKTILQGIDEAIHEGLSADGVYQNVLNAAIDYQRIDVLEEIYPICIKSNLLSRLMKEKHLYYSLIAEKFEVVEFLIDKGFKIEKIDPSVKAVLPKYPLNLLKKIHEKALNLTTPNLNLLVSAFYSDTANIEMINYLVSLGLNIKDNFKEILRASLLSDTKNKIDYLYRLNINNEEILVYSILSGKVKLIDYLIFKGIDLSINDDLGVIAFSDSIFKDNPNMLDIMLKKGLKININAEKFINDIAEFDAINMFKYCVNLGIDIKKVKSLSNGSKLKQLFITELYEKLEHDIIKNETISYKKKI